MIGKLGEPCNPFGGRRARQVLKRAGTSPPIERAQGLHVGGTMDVPQDGCRLIAERRRQIARRDDRHQSARRRSVRGHGDGADAGGAHGDHAVRDRRVRADGRRRSCQELGDGPSDVATAVGNPGEQRPRCDESHELGIAVDDRHRVGAGSREHPGRFGHALLGPAHPKGTGHLVQEHAARIGPLVRPLEVGRDGSQRRNILACIGGSQHEVFEVASPGTRR